MLACKNILFIEYNVKVRITLSVDNGCSVYQLNLTTEELIFSVICSDSSYLFSSPSKN